MADINLQAAWVSCQIDKWGLLLWEHLKVKRFGDTHFFLLDPAAATFGYAHIEDHSDYRLLFCTCIAPGSEKHYSTTEACLTLRCERVLDLLAWSASHGLPYFSVDGLAFLFDYLDVPKAGRKPTTKRGLLQAILNRVFKKTTPGGNHHIKKTLPGQKPMGTPPDWERTKHLSFARRPIEEPTPCVGE